MTNDLNGKVTVKLSKWLQGYKQRTSIVPNRTLNSQVTGCWQGTSREKLYEELGWESLSDRRWARRLTIFYKINSGLVPSYLSDHIPKPNEININLRNRNDNKPLVQSFIKHLNDFIRPPGHSLFGIRDKFGIKLLTKIRVSFSDFT